MANLLQIHEPGQTPLPHAENAAIGIDLGTTYSVVAVATSGKAEAIHDAHGHAMIPSMVKYEQGRIIVGHEAKRAYAEGEEGVVASVKRLMGRATSEVVTSAHAEAYQFAEEADGQIRLKAENRTVMPVEVSAEILRHMKTMAYDALGREVRRAVITVPAYFDDAARTATKDAARMAGLEVLRLINEPTAAALAYGLDSQAQGIFAIYDFGGGTFDISILKLTDGVFQVLATAGDTQLGGDDIDRAIAEMMIAKHFSRQPINPMQRGELLHQCKEAKEKLSTEKEVEVLWNGEHLTLTRAMLEAMMESLITRTLDCCNHALMDANLTANDIQGVVMVGGSTRIPMVVRRVAELFEKQPLQHLDPDLVVALGAALQAEALTQGSETLLLDVAPLSLGLETVGGIVERIIERNSPIPAAVSQEFTTYQDGQSAMKIHVVQGEREKVEDCRSLAQFTLRGIPPMLAGIARIRITFTLDADGLLAVSAKELTTGAEQQIEVKPSYGLAFEEIERMIHESMQHARMDIAERLLIETRVEAERTTRELRGALAASSALLKPGEESMILGQIERLQEAMRGDRRERIDHEMNYLNQLVGPFAERRMNAAIASALAGKRVDEVVNSQTGN